MLKNLIDAKTSIELQINERICHLYGELARTIGYDLENEALDIEFQSGKSINISLNELYARDFAVYYAERSAAYN